MLEEYLNQVRGRGLKITPNRKAIVELFLTTGQALTAEDVLGKLKTKIPRLSYPVIYRNLEGFEKIGLMSRIQTDDRRLCYAINRLDHADHQHKHQEKEQHAEHAHKLICTDCGHAEDVDCFLEEIESKIARKTGFRIKEHHFQIEGVCEDCEHSQRRKSIK